MKTSFKTLSFLFFIPLLLLTYPLLSQAGEEASAQEKDIRIIDNPFEFGDKYYEYRAYKYKIINVSIDEIKERILKGEPVFFVEEQEETKRTIKSEWIIDALKKENGVEKIDIEKAIINGNLDFYIKENLVGIEESGIEVDEINKLKGRGVENVYLVSPSINIESCQIQGNLKAGYDNNLKSIVIFKKSVVFSNSAVKETNFGGARFNGEASFLSASFNGEADFRSASFKEKADFRSASFNGEASFESASFKEKADFGSASFNGEADFGGVNFKDVIVFSGCTFLSDINLQDANYQVLRISWKQLEGRLDGTISGIFKLPDDIKNVLEGKKTVNERLEEQIRYILKTENIILWEQAYLRLIKNFEDIGDKKSADDAYYHYRYNKPKFKTQFLSERSENIGVMPISLEFPEHLKSKIDYKDEQLIFKGAMSEEEKEELLRLQGDLPNSYKKAVENLYKRSQSSLEYISGISTFEKQLEHIFFGLTCGYGVRPFNALGVGLVLISSFTLFYFIGCHVFPSKDYLVYQRKEEENFSTKPIHHKLYNCFYLSVTTFTTVGYGDLQPRGGFKAAAMIEGFLGWMTMALFLVTLGNVWLR